ncbi:hypothetical protein ACN4EG_16670 [Alkalinema pantanalense CENA528]|uniref:hypothetical protein n=1 Tax=Alkalinema pantanalense TaxID=1620705 RepID=UPI003D6E6296
MQTELFPVDDYTDVAHDMTERSTKHKARFRSTRTHQLFKNQKTGYVDWMPVHPNGGFIESNKIVYSLEHLRSLGFEPIAESTYLGSPDRDWFYPTKKRSPAK